MERVILLVIMFAIADANESSFGWTKWAPGSTSLGEKSLKRSKLHKDPECGNKCYDKYSQGMDVKYERLTNLALHQPASMSSTFENFSANLVVDGITNTEMEFGSCSQTKLDASPWIRVDLHQDGHTQYVEEVVIYNRFDCCSDRANNLEVTVGDNENGVGNKRCQLRKDMGHRILRIICDEMSFGRYVHFKIPGTQILHLCEVQVLGGRFKNIALKKQVTALNVDSRYPANQLVDGDLTTRAESYNQAIPWFRIDLAEEAMIYMVQLYTARGTQYIENSIVSVGMNLGGSTMKTCGAATPYNKIRGLKDSYVIKCDEGMKGRYVQITFITSDYISISEAEVMGVI